MSLPPDDPSGPSWEEIEAEYHSRVSTPAERVAGRARRRRKVRGLIEWAAAIGGALLVAWFIQAFLVQAFVIPSASMEPTLADRDRVLVNKQSYGSGGPSRGDVVVFSRPPGVELDGVDDLIKRVVAVGGETVEARFGLVHVDGTAIDEPYLPDGQQTEDFGPVVVPDGHVFVLGDNRGPAMSLDSRFFGAVDNDLVIGRAFMVIWPPSRVSGL